MLEAKVCTFGGTVKNMSLFDIKDHICALIKGSIEGFEEKQPKDNFGIDYRYWINSRLLGHKEFVNINSKNIEFSTSFHLSEHIMSDKLLKKMRELNIADVLVLLTVYRLGQYSYFAAECDVLVPDEK